MSTLRRIAAAAAFALVALVAALAAAPAPADAATYSQRARAPQNAAGVVFHPYGDIFEIWDNVRDGRPVRVRFRELGAVNWRTITSRVRYTEVRRNLREKGNYVEFYVIGATGPSEISMYKTFGH
jgi:hypothetical protein